jgi:type II secretory pathway pseudopilin PulG
MVRERAFTMIEIALSLAVVSFALVAIMGVLPTGMTVQKDNREDILISQEGRLWLEAIKGGARGMEDLTTYVEEITLTNRGVRRLNIINNPGNLLTTGDIIALLSTPKSSTNDSAVARVKAITGSAAEKGTNTPSPFRYQLRAEVVRAFPLPPAVAQQNTNLYAYNRAVGINLFDVRLVLRWPVVERGNGWYIGNNRKTFRARVAGRSMIETNLSRTSLEGIPLLTIVPNRYSE